MKASAALSRPQPAASLLRPAAGLSAAAGIITLALGLAALTGMATPPAGERVSAWNVFSMPAEAALCVLLGGASLLFGVAESMWARGTALVLATVMGTIAVVVLYGQFTGQPLAIGAWLVAKSPLLPRTPAAPMDLVGAAGFCFAALALAFCSRFPLAPGLPWVIGYALIALSTVSLLANVLFQSTLCGGDDGTRPVLATTLAMGLLGVGIFASASPAFSAGPLDARIAAGPSIVALAAVILASMAVLLAIRGSLAPFLSHGLDGRCAFDVRAPIGGSSAQA
ncbi:MAG: hypothetical protein WBP72_06635, partial [Rhodocyclaceae bacterium]